MKGFRVFWFRRDLRLKDNHGLFQALSGDEPVQPLFIFDTEILDVLEDKQDSRVHFIHETLQDLKTELNQHKGDLWVEHGKPLEVWKKLLASHSITAVYTNHDYEPAARTRDEKIHQLLKSKGIPFLTFKDQSLFEKDEVLTTQKTPYTVYTPYKNKVLTLLDDQSVKAFPSERKLSQLRQSEPSPIPSLKKLGFQESSQVWPSSKIIKATLKDYASTRDFPAQAHGTSRLGLHLRFGTISVRHLAQIAMEIKADTYLSELIWRDFFMQILWHFPEVVENSFRPIYDKIKWRTSKADFQRWSEGQTGYPWVDAGMRELNQTGFMHNRVRMATASFLTKHLLIHWREGERYFARKLLDYDLAANNGNWQWAAGSGCDAAPYFRVFNPTIQAKKFDPQGEYLRKWIPELDSSKYPEPMIDHNEARGRALATYGKVLKKGKDQ